MLSPLLMTRIFIHYGDQEERGLKHFPCKQPFWNFRHGVESEVNDKRFSGFLYWKKRNFTCKRLVGRCTFIIRTFYYPRPYVETGTMGIDDKTIQPVILTHFLVHQIYWYVSWRTYSRPCRPWVFWRPRSFWSTPQLNRELWPVPILVPRTTCFTSDVAERM